MADLTDRDSAPTGIRRFVPMLDWLPHYGKVGNLRVDIIAGVSVAALLIPESLGYAEIAGVPPEIGLYAAAPALIAYAVFGSSRLLIVAGASAVSAVSAGIVGGLSSGDEEAAIALTAGLAVVAGLIFLAFGIARMGWVSNFMSNAVMEGFIVGLSISIIIGQLGSLVGAEVEGENALLELLDLIRQIPEWDLLTVVVGAGSLALLFLIGAYLPKVPAALVVVVLSIVIVSLLSLDEEGLHIVGEIPQGLPSFGVPDIDASQWLALIPGGFAIVLVGFSEGFAAAKDVAEPGEQMDANQELIGYGAASLGAGLSNGMVVSGSLSKTAANEEAGATTQVAGLVSAALVVLTLLVLAPLFTNLAEASLAAIVIHAVWNSADVRRLLPFRAVQPTEFALAVTVLLVVLLVGEIQGVIVGVIISLLILVYRISFPGTAVLGRDAETGRMVDLDTHPGSTAVPGVVIYRFDAPLIYSNSSAFVREGIAAVTSRNDDIRLAVIDCEVISDVDENGVEALVNLVNTFRSADIDVRLVRMHHGVLAALERGGAINEIGADSILRNPEDALDDQG